MDLSIVIVSWKIRDLLQKNLEAIFKSAGGISFEVFVVDNKSSDGTFEMVGSEFPQVNLILNNYNAGFAKANNQAIEMAQGKYVLLLNPDMQVFPDTFQKMFEFMERRTDVGVASCRLIDAQGKNIPHVRKFPTLLDQLAIVLKIPHVYPEVLDKYLMKDFDYNKESEVDSVRGSFFMIRKEVIDAIGKLDERYFIWFEEVDYCKRVINAGMKVVYNPGAKCVDYVGKSFSQVKRGRTQEYFRNSMLEYFSKWGNWFEFVVLYLAWPIGKLLAFVADTLKIEKGNKM
ncbi:MAG: glycosyltransferase family 2 protein [Patescibacteria group bacterium]|jgi:GT2 family glycosyltransferase|nr:glycosyltransferase family 2 protein [Patescibacteria group bacterium]